ncbi:hypothetical protein LOAG_15123 [Loa loa]|uniref:Uncharacterized protein n=1 Tax=Loa loa TaxID=7209 RepID=A0A1S0TGX6_LOALO|nr:hypothetical protein LOAG_15123 [Loa loa]EFO13406.1 hypothetical protein LOAG_15123 [Loa loa]
MTDTVSLDGLVQGVKMENKTTEKRKGWKEPSGELPSFARPDKSDGSKGKYCMIPWLDQSRRPCLVHSIFLHLSIRDKHEVSMNNRKITGLLINSNTTTRSGYFKCGKKPNSGYFKCGEKPNSGYFKCGEKPNSGYSKFAVKPGISGYKWTKVTQNGLLLGSFLSI